MGGHAGHGVGHGGPVGHGSPDHPPERLTLGREAVELAHSPLERSAAAASSGATGLKNTPDPSSPAAT
jgi:hypothetical protein